MVVGAGDNVTIKLNVSSLDGPVTIEVWNSQYSYMPTPNVTAAIGETEISLGRMWNTAKWTKYSFLGIFERNGTAYLRGVVLDIYVRG